MSDINKLIASLHIEARDLKSEVDAVNKEQKRIGEGTNLDLTKQVKEQIKLLKTAMGGENQGAGKRRSAEADALRKEVKLVNSLSQDLLRVEKQLASLREKEFAADSGTQYEGAIKKQILEKKNQIAAIKEEIAKVSEAAKAQSRYQETIKKTVQLQNLVKDKLEQAGAKKSDDSAVQSLKEEVALANRLSSELLNAEKAIADIRARMNSGSAGEKEADVLQNELQLRRQEAEMIRERIKNISVAALEESNYKKVIEQVDEAQRKLNAELAKQDDVNDRKTYNKQVADTKKQIAELKKAYSEIGKIKTELARIDRLGIDGDYAAELREQQNAKLENYAAEKESIELTDQKILKQAEYNSLLEHEKKVDDSNRLKQMRQVEEEQRKLNRGQQEYNAKLQETIKHVVQWATSMLVMRTLANLWRNATEYVAEYYDKMNEIRIVTGMTQAEADKLGESYRKIASQMSVSSKEVAAAAVEFWRQGLDESEVADRQDATIKYAKVSGQEFEAAAEIITATTNSIESDVARAADVLVYLGDASASGADEVGIAMQKAAASAEQFGLSFEWLGAYIATVSEETRQAPEVIGTALNSIMARMHQIKQSGFNDEDETSINDVAKALGTIDVALLDQEGNWRDMSDIINDVAAVWDTLSDKQQGYITTVMAGTRQQNIFLTLMNDLSSGIENGSRAWELYAGAVNSAGAASKKYEIWQDSVAAAQGDLKAAQEDLYALLSADWMKGFYHALAEIVKWITKGTNATKGLNLGLGTLAGTITSLFSASKKAGGLWSALKGIVTQMGPLKKGALVLTAVSAAMTLLGNTASSTKEKFEDASKTYEETIERIDKLSSYKKQIAIFEELASKTQRTSKENERQIEAIAAIKDISPEAELAIEKYSEKLINEKEAVRLINEQLEREQKLKKELAKESALTSLRNWQAQSFETMASQSGMVVPMGASFEDTKNSYVFNAHEQAIAELEIQQLISEYALALTNADFSQIEKAEFSRRLMEKIFGGDELLSYGEYKNAASVIIQNIEEIGKEIAEKTSVESNGNIIEEIFRDVFGAWQYQWFSDNITWGLNLAKNDPKIAEEVSNAYEELIEKGYSSESMKSIFTSYVNSGYKMNPYNIANDQLSSAFEDAGHDLESEFVWEDASGKIETLSEEAQVLMFNMMNAGSSIELFLTALKNSRSLSDFLNQLTQTNSETESAAVTSSKLSQLFANMRKEREAEAAENNLYKDQIATLKTAWEKGDNGASFNDALNVMYNSNEDLVKGMLDMHPILQDMAEGSLTYEEGLESLAAMESLATTKIRERTQEMIAQATAEKELEEAQKEHYAGTLQSQSNAYNTGFENFMTEWDNLSDEAKAGIIALYPEVAALATMTEKAADGATTFANAIQLAANIDFNSFKQNLSTDNLEQLKADVAKNAEENNYSDQLLSLENAQQTGGVEAMRKALFDLYTENEQLYNGLMKTHSELNALGDETLTQSGATNILNESRRKQLQTSSEEAQKLREKIELEERIKTAEQEHYVGVLRNLKEAYSAGGTQGFHEAWDSLDQSTQEYIMRTYEAIGNLAIETTTQAASVVGSVFESAIQEALSMDSAQLLQDLIDDARGYGAQRRAEAASENGFQDQQQLLKSSLESGTFMQTLMGFETETRNALIEENEWINGIIEGINSAEESTYNLSEAMQLFNEHLAGTHEHFMATVESLNEANQELLSTEEEKISALTAIMNALSADGVEGLKNEFNSLSGEMQNAILSESPALKKFFRDLENGTQDASAAIDELSKEIKALNLQKLKRDGAIWNQVADAIENAGKGGKAFSESYGAVIDKVEELNEAMGALNAIQEGNASTAEEQENAYSILSEYTGVSADILRGNLEPALLAITGDMDLASMSASYLSGWLWSAAGVTFSAENWQAQLAALAGSADATTSNIARLVQTMLQCAGASLYLDGDTIKVNWGRGSYTPPAAASKGGGKSGGGGGGGGKSNADDITEELKKLLEKMDETVDIEDHRRKIMQMAHDYHEARGEIQGVLLYLENEKEIVQNNRDMQMRYISTIEEQMEAKRKVLAQTSASSKRYKQAMLDLDALQEKHKDYSKQLLQNKIDLEELEEAMRENNEAVREMQIDLQETIRKAIEDREALNERMLDGTIETENEILEIIRSRYEEERDLVLESSQEKINSLEKEKALLQEQLDLRKQQAAEEDRAAQLAQLESQLARISADPTRKKEEMELRKEIAELREEIAWDIADKEVEAQQKAIDEQITSVEDYMEYIENYYEDLFAHPTKLINEMKEILRKSDEEIIQWLKDNSEEYAASTENTQRDMVNSWNDMLMDMHGQIKTYWEEVEQIIAGGDDTIIAFLKENSADYKAAGKLQAEAYVDEWRKQLDDLKKALKEVNAEISVPDYSTIDKGTGSSSGGGGGSGGSSSSKTEVYTVKDAAGNTYTSTRLGTAKAYASQAADRNPPAVVIDPSGKIIETYTGSRDSTSGIVGTIASTVASTVNAGTTAAKTGIANLIAGVTGSTVKKYATGGMADYTGPAWLDGTKSNPERILSPYQTKLFDEMIKVLQRIDTISVPGIPAYGETGKANSAYNVGDIIVNVDRLESDADYEEMAEKIFDTIMNRLNRTAPVGGIRMNR